MTQSPEGSLEIAPRSLSASRRTVLQLLSGTAILAGHPSLLEAAPEPLVLVFDIAAP